MYDRFGSLWVLATDGAANRRIAMNMIFRSVKLCETANYYKYLARMKGLDLMTSDEGTVECYDLKHLIKRFRERLKSKTKSIYIGNVALSRDFLMHSLKRYGNVTDEDLNRLFDPEDKMNVSTAMELLQSIIDCGQFTESQPLNMALDVLKIICQSMLDPFKTNLNLKQQLTSLTTLAHLTAFLYHVSGCRFIPSCQYHDIHAWIKCILFCTAREKNLELEYGEPSNLYICKIGSDAQEDLHGVVRTLSHNRNFNMLELGINLSIATEIMQVGERNPSWKKADRRRSTNANNDNFKPRHFTDYETQYTCGSLDLHACWNDSLEKAIDILTPMFTTSQVFGFFEKFVNDDSITYMSPEGQIVGVSTPAGEDEDENGKESERIHVQNTSDGLATPTETNVEMFDDDTKNQWMEVNGKRVHKRTIMKQLFSSTAMSTDRIRRVRYYSKFESSKIFMPTLQSSSAEEVDTMICEGDPILCLVQCKFMGAPIVVVAICTIDCILQSNTNTSTFNIPVEELDPSIIFTVRVKHLTSEPDSHCSWSVHSKDNHTQFKISSEKTRTISPSVNADDKGILHMVVCNSSVIEAGDLLWHDTKYGMNASKPPEKIQVVQPNLVYNVNDLPAFIVHAAQDDLINNTPQMVDGVYCDLCSIVIKQADWRQHQGYHIMAEDVELLPFQCGFCLKEEVGCAPIVKKNMHRTLLLYSNCAMKYKLNFASISKNICTNRPVKCNLCSTEKDTFIWLYSMALHYSTQHVGIVMPSDLQVPSGEKTELIKEWEKKIKAAKKKGGKRKR